MIYDMIWTATYVVILGLASWGITVAVRRRRSAR